MSDTVTVPAHGDSNGGGLGTFWTWKPCNPITQIDMVGNSDLLHSITFKTNANTDSATYGESDANPQEQKNLVIDMNGRYLVGIRGAYIQWSPSKNAKYFMSLSFETNLGTVSKSWPQPNYKKFRVEEFSYRAPNGSHIIGFHGLHGCSGVDSYLNAIGVYVSPSSLGPPPSLPPPPPQPSSSSNPIKVDAWGGKTGKEWKFPPGETINEITIYHDREINSLTFKSVEGGVSNKFGGRGGRKSTVVIEPGVRLTGIRGTYGQIENSTTTVITSLIFCTSDGNAHEPLGEKSGTEFSHDGPIIGFHGREGKRINAIGIYLRPTA